MKHKVSKLDVLIGALVVGITCELFYIVSSFGALWRVLSAGMGS